MKGRSTKWARSSTRSAGVTVWVLLLVAATAGCPESNDMFEYPRPTEVYHTGGPSVDLVEGCYGQPPTCEDVFGDSGKLVVPTQPVSVHAIYLFSCAATVPTLTIQWLNETTGHSGSGSVGAPRGLGLEGCGIDCFASDIPLAQGRNWVS
jgi:hypothetical protein